MSMFSTLDIYQRLTAYKESLDRCCLAIYWLTMHVRHSNNPF